MRFHQMEIENATKVESASRAVDDVEFRRAQLMGFCGHRATAGSSNLKQPALALGDTTRTGTHAGSTLSMVELLGRERKIQDMYNDGVAVVRLIKVCYGLTCTFSKIFHLYVCHLSCSSSRL